MPDSQAPSHKVQLGKALCFDCSTKQLSTGQQAIDLNRAEREVLYSLVTNAPRMVLKADLLQAGWVRKEVTPTSLFQTIRNLRIKLKEEEKGQIIELVPKLGYRIIVSPYVEPVSSESDNEAEKVKPRKKSKRRIFFALFVLTTVILSSLYHHYQAKRFYHKITSDDDNNTVVLLSEQKDDLAYLLTYSDQYITPKDIRNKLFFIAKSNEYYSIAFCDKTSQNYCDPETARAVTLKHFDLSSFWPLLTEESMAIGSMSVYKGDTKIKASAKSYNLYLENGKISPNLSQYFVHKKQQDTWTFTGISYRMNKDKTEFVAISFKGGQFTLKNTSLEPFIAMSKTTPEYFYWINSQEELTKMGIKLPGEVKNYENSLYKKAVGYNNYMLYRQRGLFLWYSPEVGFYWFSKQGYEDSNFAEFFQFAKCKDFLQLNPDPECN